MKKELMKFTKWLRQDKYLHTGHSDLFIVNEYLNFINSDANDESLSVGSNEAKGEFCKFPNGFDKCNYKSKEYWVCKGLRNCQFAK